MWATYWIVSKKQNIRGATQVIAAHPKPGLHRPKRCGPSGWQRWAGIEALVAPNQRVIKLHPHHADLPALRPLKASNLPNSTIHKSVGGVNVATQHDARANPEEYSFDQSARRIRSAGQVPVERCGSAMDIGRHVRSIEAFNCLGTAACTSPKRAITIVSVPIIGGQFVAWWRPCTLCQSLWFCNWR